MAPAPLPLPSAMEVNAGNMPMELGSARPFLPSEPVSKHQAPHSGVWDTNQAPSRATSSPIQPKGAQALHLHGVHGSGTTAMLAQRGSHASLPPPLCQPGSWQPSPQLLGLGTDLNFK